MRQIVDKFISALSMGASFNSAVVPCTYGVVGSIQIIWTGTPVGNFTIQVSNDQPVGAQGGDAFGALVTNWTTLTGSTQAAGGAAGDFIYNFDPICWNFMRLVYTRSSSTGTINGSFIVKGV